MPLHLSVFAQFYHKVAAWYKWHIGTVQYLFAAVCGWHSKPTSLRASNTFVYLSFRWYLLLSFSCCSLVFSSLLSFFSPFLSCWNTSGKPNHAQNPSWITSFQKSIQFKFFPLTQFISLSHFWLSCSPIVGLILPQTVLECFFWMFFFSRSQLQHPAESLAYIPGKVGSTICP